MIVQLIEAERSPEMAKLTNAQLTTLRTIEANGGEMNNFAGQNGFYCRSMPALVRAGMLQSIGICACFRHEPCDREHPELIGQRSGQYCYGRVRLTDAGKAVL